MASKSQKIKAVKAVALEKFPLFIALCVSIGLLFLLLLGVFDGMDYKWVDSMFRWRGMERGDPRVVVVAIDDESIKYIGQFPWPRSVYSKLLDRLFADGASVVGLDILFPDLSYPEQDKALVAAARKWGKRVVFASDTEPNILQNDWRYPFPALKAAGKSFGLVNQFLIDSDGEVRKAVLFGGVKPNAYNEWPHDPNRLPSLGLRILSIFQQKDPDEYFRDRDFYNGNSVRLNIRGQEAMEVGSQQDAKGNQVSVMNFAYGIRRIGAWAVLKNDLIDTDRGMLKGAMVLIGSTTEGAYDHYPTPFTDLAPGVEVHANLIDNLLNHRDLRPAPWWMPLLLILGFALLSAYVLELGPLYGTLAIVGAFIAWLFAGFVLFKHRLLLPYVAPSLALAAPFSLLLVRRTLSEQREKKFIKQTFGQYVAPEVVDILVQDPEKIKLGGEKREMTVFFLDIAHFTNISEKMGDPEKLIGFLNFYLTPLTDIIQKHNGVVDKYIGDCIMAFWNAPLDEPDHRALACLAAVECQEALPGLNAEYAKQNAKLSEEPAFRIGINSGSMVVGNTGSTKKKSYTVLGDEVNLASRLEGANKFFSSRVLISETCYAGARDQIEARELGRVLVVGKDIPIRVYEPLAKKGGLSEIWRKALPLFNGGIAAFQKGVDLARKKDSAGAQAAFTEAKGIFEQFLKIMPDDGPAKHYLNICEDYSQIPPMDFDGVFNIRTK